MPTLAKIKGYDLPSGGEAYVPTIFSAYHSAGGVTVGTSWTDIPWTNELTKDAGYTHGVDSAEVSVADAGRYKITFEATATVSDNGRSHVDWRMLVEGVEPGGTIGATYHRLSADGKGSVTITYIATLSAGDVVKCQGKSDRATQVTTVAGGCRFIIEKK